MSVFSVPTVADLRQRWYGDEREAFESLLDSAVCGARAVLLLGAGRGVFERDVRSSGRAIVGLDVDHAIFQNPCLDRAVVYDGRSFPFHNGAFDVCSARWVIEHLADPESTLREVARALRPGGRFIFITTNAWFYGSIVARLIPNALHPTMVRLMTGRETRDTFRTHYRANTRRKLRRLLTRLGFREESLAVELQDPTYLQFSLPTYLLGVAFERVVNAIAALEDLRQAIIGSFVRD